MTRPQDTDTITLLADRSKAPMAKLAEVSWAL